MQPRELDGVVVDECPSCSLRWLDDGELEVLLAARTSWSVEALGPARSPCESASWCAVCHHSTVAIRFHAVPHVHIDACVEHGHWLREWQGRELMLWGRKEAALAEAVRTRPYARRFDRLRSTTIVWLVSTALACRGLSSHSVVSLVIALSWASTWAFDLAETTVAWWSWRWRRQVR